MTTGTVTVGQITFSSPPVTNLFPSPLTDPNTWNTIVVADVPWTGKIEIKSACTSWNWDGKHGRSTEGATDSYVGTKPEAFDVTFFLWTDGHFARWPQFSLLFQYQGRKGIANPAKIYHPALALVGITKVICLRLDAPEQISDDLMWAAKVKLRKFQPAAASPAITPKAADRTAPPGAGGFVGPPPLTANEAKQQLLHGLRLAAAEKGAPGKLAVNP